ncbi:hypothetical protein PN498_14880 [Oscillatoria sp. CS-180]|uniref:hypothetical protein n=1 Tax=Oscillatoria sp. CS-180 TaxID=3021720 RepID=UPI00232EEB75|nr:hypothetical protein [Oscillatoria sp. CS-180]MDB9527282.1 hypothetical protein [Oscillatoria sp. CS-180]
MKLEESEITALGASLRPINPGMMKPTEGDTAKKRIWYQGNESYFDVTAEAIADQITWFQITLRGKVVSWRSPDYLQTGETDEMDVPPDVAYYAASKTIRDGAAINWPLVETVQAILAHRPEETPLTQLNHILKSHLEKCSGS